MRPRTPVKRDGRHAANAAAVEEEKGERDRHLGLRAKKGMGVRTWLLIDIHGSSQVVEAAKHAIMRRACLPARDLRILDPLLSYPSTILGREHAIVVNLEHIKAIITAQEVLLLNSQDAAVVPFVQDLKRRLPLHLNALGQAVAGDGGGGLSDNEGDPRINTNSPMDALRQIPSGHEVNGEAAMPAGRMELQGGLNAVHRSPSLPQLRTGFKEDGSSPGLTRGGPNILPFEFRALEACLEAACSSLDAEALTLEREAYPALDELTSKISTLNLEHVRQIKSRLVAISGRVQKVRDEIEQLLDDDGDMAEMYLTDKLLQQQEVSVSPSSSSQAFGPVSPTIADTPLLDSNQAPPVSSNTASFQFDGPGSDGEEDRNIGTNGTMHDGHGGAEILSDRGHGSSSSTVTSTVTTKSLDVEELEMLLEAYFVQIDGTLNKLSTLREYVDDTEDYINIMLDDKQNHLLQMGVMLTMATLVISAFIVVTGVFGMNINIPLFNDGGLAQFLWVVLGTASISVILYFAVIGWCKYKHLIE